MTGAELAAIAEALASGHLSGDGPFTHRCHQLLESATGVRKALLTTSCTHALEMSALLLDVQPGDEVIVPSFTFVSTVNAFVLRGAVPVFADIRPDTLNLDETQLAALITPRTQGDRRRPLRRCRLRDGRDPADRRAARHRRSSKTTRTGCSASIRGRPLGTLRRAGDARASTRRRTSLAARAARC